MLWQLCKHKFQDELSVGHRSCWSEIQSVWGLHSKFWQEVKDFKLHNRINCCTTTSRTFKTSFIKHYVTVVITREWYLYTRRKLSESSVKLPLFCWCVQCMQKLCQFEKFSNTNSKLFVVRTWQGIHYNLYITCIFCVSHYIMWTRFLLSITCDTVVSLYCSHCCFQAVTFPYWNWGVW